MKNTDNRTKIIATLGPASDEKSVIEDMVQAGMDVVRLNFSHGTYEHHKKLVRNIKSVSKKLGKHIGILQDLSGPKVRIGEMPKDGIQVKRGDTIFLSTKIKEARQTQTKDKNGAWTIPVNYKKLSSDLNVGDKLLIDDGLIELKLESKTSLKCKVVVPGVIRSRKGFNFPASTLSAPPLTKKDLKDLQFGLTLGVDMVALSFVKSAEDIELLRKYIEKKIPSRSSKFPWLIAKIERHEAVANMKEIVEASDSIMVARGDLGLEVPAEQVPLIQKRLIKMCIDYGRPVITATQILHSMTKNKLATRAEISDAANAILDSTDAFMLSNETAVGEYPVHAVRTLRKVATAVENDLKKHPALVPSRDISKSRTDATCMSACQLAQDLKAKWICAITKSGYTAKQIAKHRPMTPIIAITENEEVARKLSLTWGVYRVFVVKISLRSPFGAIRALMKKHHLAKLNDEIVICNSRKKSKVKLITTGKI